MTEIIPVAGGKGGVGKTIVTANLALALAHEGKTVIAVDLDLGASNLHTCLGIRNRRQGIGHFVYGEASSLESLLMPTDYRRLFFIPGDALLPGTANLPFHRKARLIRDVAKLTADYVLLDLGAGSSYNVVDFFLTGPRGMVVIAPETTSILNAYSFLKTSLYRLIYRSLPPKSPQRQAVADFVTTRLEGTEADFRELVRRVAQQWPEDGRRLGEVITSFAPRVILNMGKSPHDIAIGARLRSIAEKNLNIAVEYVSFLHYDEAVSRSVLDRRPILETAPRSAFSEGITRTAKRVIESASPAYKPLYEDDLEDLAEQAGRGL